MGNSLSSGTIEINNFEELLEFLKPALNQAKNSLSYLQNLEYWLST